MHADIVWTCLPLWTLPLIQQRKVSTVDVVTKLTVLLMFSVITQVCSLVALGLVAGDMSALLKAYMIVHYEKIAKWKYGQDTAAENTATGRRPVAVSPLR